MPVLLAGGDQHHISGRDFFFLCFCGDVAFAGGDDENLLAVVGVKFVTNALAEVDNVDVELFAVRQQHLPADLRPGEQRAFKDFLSDGIHFDDLHFYTGFLRKRDEIIPTRDIPPAVRKGAVKD